MVFPLVNGACAQPSIRVTVVAELNDVELCVTVSGSALVAQHRELRWSRSLHDSALRATLRTQVAHSAQLRVPASGLPRGAFATCAARHSRVL